MNLALRTFGISLAERRKEQEDDVDAGFCKHASCMMIKSSSWNSVNTMRALMFYDVVTMDAMALALMI